MAQRPPEIPSELMEPPPQAGGSSITYLAAWAIMACLGASYLAAVSVRPAFLAAYLPAEGGPATEQNAADIVNIRDSIGQLQTDASKMQSEVAAQTETTRGLADRVAAIETKLPPSPDAQAAPANAEPQRTGALRQEESPENFEFPSGHPNVAAAKPSKGQPKIINSPLETGSVEESATAAPPAAVAPPKAAPAKPKAAAAAAPAAKVATAESVGAFSEPKVKKPVGIKLATGGSVDNLRISWGILSERHVSELKQLQPRYYNTVDGNGITYELVAGPFKNTAEAKKVCQSLKAQAVDCQVSSFGGNAL